MDRSDVIRKKYKIHPAFEESESPRHYTMRCWDMAVQKAGIFLNNHGFPEIEFTKTTDVDITEKFFGLLGLRVPEGEEHEKVHRLMDLYLMDLWPFYAHDYGFCQSEEWLALREKVFAAKGRKCARCGDTERLHIDHIKPKSHYPGKRLVFSNMQVLCAFCNMSKGNRHNTDYSKRAVRMIAIDKLRKDYAEVYGGSKNRKSRIAGQSGRLTRGVEPYLKCALQTLEERHWKPDDIYKWFWTAQEGQTPLQILGSSNFGLFNIAVANITKRKKK